MISIVLPTLNRPDEIIRLLKKLKLSEFQTDLEIIIVDDSEKDISDVIAKVFQTGIRYIHRGKKLGVSSARNHGAKIAKGKYLIFLDDDDEFTSDWIYDFENKVRNSPDLVFCKMRVIESRGAEKVITVASKDGRIVIPGAWMIKKSIFEKVGGFDERLLFAENTELFFRLDQLNLSIEYIDKVNFIYNQSENGGSKNLQNMIDSILIILKKHDSYLTNHVKHLYHQIAGVNLMRFRNYPLARTHLWKAWIFKPYKLATLGRLGIAFLPPLAKNLYKPEVRK